METNNIIKRIHPYTFCIICKGSNDYYIVGNDVIIYSYLSFEKAKTKVKLKNQKQKEKITTIKIIYKQKLIIQKVVLKLMKKRRIT